MSDKFVTVFFDENSDEMPQDFPTYAEAKEYAEEKIKEGRATSYDIESPC